MSRPPRPGCLAPSSARAVLAGEEAGGQRVVVDDAELLLPADRLEFGLEFLAVGEVVERLQALVARQTELRCWRRAKPSAAPGVMLEAPIARTLPAAISCGIGLHGLFRRRDLIVEMGLVEIDMVGLQAPQRGLAFAQDVVLPQAAAFAHVLADLGGDQHLVALAAAS